MDEVTLQQKFFSAMAPCYDSIHATDDEHGFALSWLEAHIEFFGFQSYLEIGAGTGRALAHLHSRLPQIVCLGIEPVRGMREQGYARGLSREILIEGDAYHLQFPDSSFDVVSEFAILHHVKNPSLVVAEMLRVSRKAVFISDCNNFGHGKVAARLLKLSLRCLRLCSLFNYIRTLGRGYYISEGDGVSYSYSVFNNLKQIRKACSKVYVLNTRPLDINHDPLLSASHVALLALKLIK